MKYLFLLLISLASWKLHSQSINHWNTNPSEFQKGISVHYENDLFARNDIYYSQGISVDYFQFLSPNSKLNSWCFKTENAQKRVRFALDHLVFTPSSIQSDTVRALDRPYATTLQFHGLFETTDSLENETVGWSISAGIIGPEAGGKQMQTGIHRATNNFLPLGWQHQINTGLLLNLGVMYQKELLENNNFGSLKFTTGAIFGTGSIQQNNALRLSFATSSKRFSATIYGQPAMRFVFYDATLQGSLFGKHSELIINSRNISRLVAQHEAGVVFRYKNIALNVWYCYQSQTFELGTNHRWGGLKVIVGL